ncbi:MAG: glutamine synthetase III [Planctomycetota bacterium]
MSNARKQAIHSIATATRNLAQYDYKSKPTKELFGTNVFNVDEQRARLPKPAFKALRKTVEEGESLSPEFADVIASAMKDWAMEKGATHFTHLFQPMTGLTAEKHDSFLSPLNDGKAISSFSGKELVKGEPDASSFPSGGLRATFEARGYTAWDPTSPAFVMENPNGATLVIPTAFLSYTGEALDKKTPLLRSMAVIDTQAKRILKLFGKEPARVFTTVGAEQEYFLVDKALAFARPDLITCDRTLFGAKPPKGHEQDDHYFGAIPDRVLAFMADAEAEMFKLGVPVKTRHNEVAPGQFEVAPIFETTNVAVDHQMVMMSTLKKTAEKYGLMCILHEKPFARVNGSGKHNNWSMSTTDGENLLDPSDNPHDNAQFLVFTAAIISAIYTYGDVLRMAIASAANDHRLGANEAPPAILSVFLGEQLEDVFSQIAENGSAPSSKQGGVFATGVDILPDIPKEAGDRNRTSPFAFTGNKFELRAVGGSHNISGPNTVLNAMVAERMDYMATHLEAAVGKGEDLHKAIQSLMSEMIKEAKPVIFNGDNYSEEWHKEAERRGLPNLKNAADALDVLKTEKAINLFSKYGIYTKPEIEARFNILAEQYINTLAIEGGTAGHIAKTMILPAAVRYAEELGEAAEVLGEDVMEDSIGKLKSHVGDFVKLIAKLDTALEHEHGEDLSVATKFMRDEVLGTMNELREVGDALEDIVADDLWPLPTYREMLFIR